MLVVHNEDLLTWLRPTYTVEHLQQLRQFLQSQGTFRFPRLPTGLFSAALAHSEEFKYTGYSAVWVRDNVHVARMFLVTGELDAARGVAAALLKFYRDHQQRVRNVVRGEADPHDVMQRPHIRFNGQTLQELDVKWSHAQNDALGGFLWLVSTLALHDPQWALTSDDLSVLAGFIRYFETIRYWQDEDNGHWEEARKVEASSIGTAVAGLQQLLALFDRTQGTGWTFDGVAVVRSQLEALITQGQNALNEILPAESVQPPPLGRQADSALLFLCYPWNVVDAAMQDRIVHNVLSNLQGAYGIRRYLGDSYWCADYKSKLPPECRTVDVSDDMSARDALLQKGLEAQWCLFDPIVSILFGQRYARTGAKSDLALQVHHFNRSLGQLTAATSPFGAYRCPESYYSEQCVYVPNDATPLLWTQANLRLAFHHLEQNVSP